MTLPNSEQPKPEKVVAADGHTYHKSATANAPVAPTNEHTVANAVKQGALTAEELDFVTVVHYEWGLKAQLPAFDFLFKEYGYTAKESETYYRTDQVLKALEERGVPVSAKHLEPVGIKTTGTVKPSPKLTPIQLVVANVLLDLSDTRSEKKKLQDHGIPTSKYQMWLRDEAFRDYLKDRAEALLGDSPHEAILSLMDKVRAGDSKALSMYFEMTGRYVSASSSQGQGTTHDVQYLVTRIVEIIIDEIDDPQQAARIADRMKGLITGAQVSGILAAPEPIVQPEIAKPRELTPEVQAMQAKGLGYNS